LRETNLKFIDIFLAFFQLRRNSNINMFASKAALGIGGDL
jgi:hypothetical protein